jgi:hypothetical protein
MAEPSSGATFKNKVYNQLLKERFNVVAEPAINGLRPDFLVRAPDGRSIIVEAKSWSSTPRNITRAAHQLQYYKKLAGADDAFIVISNLKKSDFRRGIISIKDLPKAIRKQPAQAQKKAPRKRKARAFKRHAMAKRKGGIRKGRSRAVAVPAHSNQSTILFEERMPPKNIILEARKRIFAAMPLAEKYDDVYFVAMRYAADQIGAVCERIDNEEFAGDIIREIKDRIKRSIAVIGDLSESNPNVLYEVGYAQGLNIPTVHICSTPLSELPFDVKPWNTIRYNIGQTHLLKDKLVDRLKAVLKKS